MRVLSARGVELEGGFSFGVARQLLERLVAESTEAERAGLLGGAAHRALIALDDPGSSPVGPGDPPFAVVHGLYWLVVNACRAGPLLIAMDDLHWADQASLRFLLYLAGRVEGLPIALALTWRAAEVVGAGVADCLARLEQMAAGGPVFLQVLSRAAVGVLVSEAFGAPPDEEFAAACLTVSGGNPFLVRELIENLRAEDVGPEAASAGYVMSLGPRPVARAVARRLERLGPTAGELARAAAILGDEAALRHAAALAGIHLADAAAAADRLAGIGVLEPGTPLRFVHSIVRTAVHDDIPPAVRGLRHAAAARLLAGEGADADVVCSHLLVCEPAGSLEAVERLRAAAVRAVSRGAPESAAAYLRRAVKETADVGMRAVLLHELGRAEKVLFDPAAAGHLRESLALAEDAGRGADIAADLAELLVLAGQWDAGAAIVRAVLDELAPRDREPDDSAYSAITRLESWWARFGAYDPELVGEFDRRLPQLLGMARGQGPGARALAGLLAGVLAWRAEPTETVRALLDHALDGNRLLAQADSDPLLVAQAVFAAVWLEEPAPAEGLIGELLALSRSRGSVPASSIAAYARAAIRARHGDLVGAETDVRAIVDMATEHGVTFAVPGALYWAIDALIERPALADVAGIATGIVLAPDLARSASGAMLREVRGRIALASGDYDGARRELRAAAQTYEALGLLGSGTCWRSALALAVDEPRDALRLADMELDRARRTGSPRPAGIAIRTRGMLTGGERGLSDLRDAAELLSGSGARLEHARALVELGAAMRRGNQRSAAREPLRAGLDLAYRCGAERLARRAATELRATGARPRRAVLTGLEALTPSERRVAEHAASGMSNPEIAQALFVTLNTVEGHLRRVYQKLAISSRSELPRALRSAAPSATTEPGGQASTASR